VRRRTRPRPPQRRRTPAPPANFQAIAQCESGGNPAAVGGGGTYRGLYQFDQQTWQSVGGSGDPAAASPAEQTRRAEILYAQRGASAWPVCRR
jgi:soluble lytic murein transglycosylase-like protein